MSSKRAIRRRACEGKTRFETAELAHQAAARARGRRQRTVQAYRCPFCSGYHIGHRGRAAHSPRFQTGPPEETTMTASTPTPETIVRLRLEEVHPAADNVRAAVGDVTELAASIASAGVIEPLIVVPAGKNGGYTVVVGHRRLAGAKLAGVPNVPAIIRELDERARVEAMLVENLQREDLTPLEEAEAYRRLVALGIGQVELAKRIGRSQAHVSKRLALLKLPDVARTALAAGEVNIADAAELGKFEPEVIQKTLAALKGPDRRYPGEVLRVAESVKYRVDFERRRNKTLEELKAAKVSIITTSSDGYQPAQVRNLTPLGDGYGQLPMSVKAHAAEPCHAAWVDQDGKARYVCTKPSNHLKSEVKAIAKAAKAISSGGRSAGPAADKKAAAKAAATRERNKALRAAAPGRMKAIGARLGARQAREAVVDFTLRQLLQLVLDRQHGAGRLAAELLGVKGKDRDGDPRFPARKPAEVLAVAYAVALCSGEVPFRGLVERGYFDQELAPNGARLLEHLRLAGYRPVKAEVDAVADAIKAAGSWRPAWDK